MKTTDGLWTQCLWTGWILVFALYAVGGAVKVPWGSAPVPLSVVLKAIDWSAAARVYRNQEFPVFALAGAVATLYSLTRSGRLRFALMLAGFVCPLLLLDADTALGGLVVAPFLVFGALAGGADGEFYAEGMPQIAAVGLWMLLCLFFASYRLYSSLPADAGAAPACGRPLPSSRVSDGPPRVS